MEVKVEVNSLRSWKLKWTIVVMSSTKCFTPIFTSFYYFHFYFIFRFHASRCVRKMSLKRMSILLDTTALVLALPTSKLPPSTK